MPDITDLLIMSVRKFDSRKKGFGDEMGWTYKLPTVKIPARTSRDLSSSFNIMTLRTGKIRTAKLSAVSMLRAE